MEIGNSVSGIGNGVRKSGISYGNRDAWELGIVYGKSGIVFGIEMNRNREWCK